MSLRQFRDLRLQIAIPIVPPGDQPRKSLLNKDWPPPLSVKGTNVSNVFEECMYHEPELQDEAALSAWIAIWSPRISRDADATRNLITQIFEMEDPDFLPYIHEASSLQNRFN